MSGCFLSPGRVAVEPTWHRPATVPAAWRSCWLVLPAVVALASLGIAAEPELPPIFNGRDLSGWKAPAEPYWKVVDGVLVGANDEAKKGSMLYTEKSYGDVILEGEVRWTGEIDSGFMLRKPEVQVQIGVSRSLKRDMTCSFYVGKYPEEAQAKRAGELLRPGDWNRIRVEARGDTFTVFLNGQQVSRYTDAKYKDPGPIGLQIHAGLVMQVEFRDLRAREL
ncbi:MAG: DUF1080 domain-containing protein [Planctomycetes bacterium]|nr:DUF1080 domain-containing protein [Planctomycetota bacterium]